MLKAVSRRCSIKKVFYLKETQTQVLSSEFCDCPQLGLGFGLGLGLELGLGGFSSGAIVLEPLFLQNTSVGCI